MRPSVCLVFWVTAIVFHCNVCDELSSKEELDEDYQLLNYGYGLNYNGSKLRTRRWSLAPKFLEDRCGKLCRLANKPFGRLVGTRCQCLCPVNTLNYYSICSDTSMITCHGFCQSIGYRTGGDCYYNLNCFCFCGKKDSYNASIVYTTPLIPLY